MTVNKTAKYLRSFLEFINFWINKTNLQRCIAHLQILESCWKLLTSHTSLLAQLYYSIQNNIVQTLKSHHVVWSKKLDIWYQSIQWFVRMSWRWRRHSIPPGKAEKGQRQEWLFCRGQLHQCFYRTYLLPSIEQDSPIRDPTSSIGRKFQRSFRVPFCVFEDICSDIKRVKSLPGHSFDAKGAESVCISLLV